MAAPTTTEPKKTDSKQRKYAHDLAREIDTRAEKLPSAERKRRHDRVLEIANRKRT